MKRKFVALLAVAALAAGLMTGCGGDEESKAGEPAEDTSLEDIKEAGVMRVGMCPEYPPFESLTEDGDIEGFDADLAAAIAEKLGVEVEFVNTPYEGLIAGLQNGDFDIIMSGMSPEEADGAEETLCVTDNYYAVSEVILTMDSSIKSKEDLEGKTIYSAGKGATPEYALQHVLKAYGLEVGKDVRIEWKSEHAECVAALAADSEAVAMLPQPFAATAMMKDSGIRIALDLNELWQEKTGHVLITGVTVARKDFIESDGAALGTFLDSYKASVDYINENAAGDGAAIVGHYGIVPEAVAKAAIPYCNIVLVTGDEMKDSLSGYLDILYEQNPQSVGGAVPGVDFYYSR